MRHGALLLLIGLLLVALTPAISAQGPVAVFITSPDAAATGETVVVNVTAAGGPAEDGGTYSLKAFLRGPDLLGASPTEGVPAERTSSNNTFSINVTMPLGEQQVELVVEVNSTDGGQWSLGSATKRISVLVPLQVSAQVVNHGTVEVRDIPVYLYLDGQRVNETVLGSLKPGESRTVSFTYLPVGLAVGTHTLEIAVDFNGDGLIDAALGEVVRQITFTKESEPINPFWIFVGVVAAIVGALFVGAFIRQRRRGG